MKHLLYSLVDCPPPPHWLVERSLERLENSAAENYSGALKWPQKCTKPDTKISPGKYNRAIFLDQESLLWAKDNISTDVMDMRICTTESNSFPVGRPHIDFARRYTGIFLLETGGDDHQTCFYRSKITNEMTGRPGDYIDDFNDTEIVCCVKLSKKRWALINSYVFHGIVNIPNRRMSLQFSVDRFDNLPLTEKIIFE